MRDYHEMMELADMLLKSPGRPVNEDGERLLNLDEAAFIMGVTPEELAHRIEDLHKDAEDPDEAMRQNGIYPIPMPAVGEIIH